VELGGVGGCAAIPTRLRVTCKLARPGKSPVVCCLDREAAAFTGLGPRGVARAAAQSWTCKNPFLAQARPDERWISNGSPQNSESTSPSWSLAKETGKLFNAALSSSGTL